MDVAAGTKRDQIVEHLRRQIAGGDLHRGERLRQDALAEQFGTSITPVCEALSILESDGLVTSEPHRGVRVATVDLDRVTSVYVLRRLSEPFAMRRATLRTTVLDLTTADRLIDQISAAAADGDHTTARRLNREFHFAFYDRCGIAGLRDHIAALWSAFPWDLVLTDSTRIANSEREHREIVDAVRSGDTDRVEAAAATHIHLGFVAVTAALGSDVVDDPFIDPTG